ncbi:MAG TPA: hypothetical protein VJA21_26505 [Verrucomicrobiae bacterium]
MQFAVLGLLLFWTSISGAGELDLSDAVVVTAGDLPARESKAVQMLLDEIEKRTHVRLTNSHTWPSANIPVIGVGVQPAVAASTGPYASELQAGSAPRAAEGYRICTLTGRGNPAVFVIGNDSRGVLFGVGRLLREFRMRPGSVILDENLEITSAPKYPLRGHQLGYRPKCNSYDAWDLPAWEQYFRDLAVFGCNAVELIPPRSDDDADSPHFPLPPMDMMVGMSRLAEAYGLDVWIWYPAMDKDYSNPATVDFALREWGQVFQKLPRIDAVFVPGGDPGHTQPKHLMDLLEKQTRNLHRFHPKAQMWVSPQSFNQAWLDEFLQILTRDRPAWLSGVVFGPQVRISLPRLRELVPAQYPMRHYPDITHSRQCQYPVPGWDTAYAVTEARECINPRPEDEAAIFRKLQPFTVGFLTYSEGCNDDVNKIIWSALGWDPEISVTEILRQYSRYFIGERYTDDFTEGLLALERNWQGPLLGNEGVSQTLARFQALEKRAPPADLKNWRFQQALFRAYYDAFIRQRLLFETELEHEALDALRAADRTGALASIESAEVILKRATTERVAGRLRDRILELGEALFQSVGMQLSVEKYRAIAVDRGASLDTLEFPLNNRLWLEERFTRVRRLASDSERLAAITEILNWTNPGPGGFYDDLGNAARQPHLIRPLSFAQDPGAMESPRVGFEEDLVVDDPEEKAGAVRRMSWIDHAETLYDAPLRMRYMGLDPKAHYRLRVVYGGDNFKRKLRLIANGTIEVHPYLAKPVPIKPLEFPLAPASTEGGDLTLSWFGEPGLGGNGRGCQVSEVWLIKEPTQSAPRTKP